MVHILPFLRQLRKVDDITLCQIITVQLWLGNKSNHLSNFKNEIKSNFSISFFIFFICEPG